MPGYRETTERRSADAAAAFDVLLRNGEKKLDEKAMADAALRGIPDGLDDDVQVAIEMAGVAIETAIAEAAQAEADATLALGRAATQDVVTIAGGRRATNAQADAALTDAASASDHGADAIADARAATAANTDGYDEAARAERIRAARAEVEIAYILDEIYGAGR